MEEKEILIHGARSEYIADFLISNGAVLLRIEEPDNFVFIDDDNFSYALALFQIELRRGFFDTRKEV